jgi:hypothetical protein
MLKKSKAPRPPPVGLIKNWEGYPNSYPDPEPTSCTKTSTYTSSIVNSMPQSLDFIYGEGGISDSDERVEHAPAAAAAVSPAKYVKTEHKVSHDQYHVPRTINI